MANKDSTRYKSNIQEKRLAKGIGGRQVIGSGATPFLKGDVVAGNLFIEAKTKMEERIKRDLTLEQVAEYIEMTPKTVQRYEQGERKIKIGTIIKICQSDCQYYLEIVDFTENYKICVYYLYITQNIGQH